MKEEAFVILRNKLKSMRFSGMADELERQFNDPTSEMMGGDERIHKLVEAEFSRRQEKKQARFLKRAGIKYTHAYFGPQMWENGTGISEETVKSLQTLDWLRSGKNIIITGPTGCGKTWLASAIAVLSASKYHETRYKRANLLLQELARAEASNELLDLLEELQKVDLLVIDDFGMMRLTLNSCRNLFELIEGRDEAKSTIIVSQYPVSAWHPLFENATYADACMDRILHQAYRIELGGDSRRKS